MAHRVPSEPPVVRGYGPAERGHPKLATAAFWVLALLFLVVVGGECGDVEDPTGPPEHAIEMSR